MGLECRACGNEIKKTDRYCKKCGENNPDFEDTNAKSVAERGPSLKSEQNTQNQTNHAGSNQDKQNQKIKTMPESYQQQLREEKRKIEAKHRAYLKEYYNQRDYATTGELIIAFVIPVVGLIMGAKNRVDYPHKSAQIINASLVGFIVNITVLFIYI